MAAMIFSNVEVGKVFKIDGMVREVVDVKKNIALLECRPAAEAPVSSFDVCVCETRKKDNWMFLPPTDTWGEKGFTYNDYEKAKGHLEALAQI